MKIHRAIAVAAALFAVAAGSGCSSSDGGTQETSDDHLGESEAPLARFAPYMRTLETTFVAGRSAEETANALLASGRPAAFSLQALCRLYSDADDHFKEIRDDFKGLEDGIGAYDKWNGVYQAAVSEHKDAATLDRLKKQRDDALATFTKMLTDRQWITQDGTPTRLKTIQDFLNGFDWKTRKDDRKLVLKRMIKELEDIKDTTYDMKILENGNGIHELRRDIRWVLIEQLTLHGMVTLKDGAACPIPAYASVSSDGRYGNLQASPLEPSPCQVSACVVFASAKTVNDLGDLKDQAEQEVNIADGPDVVPERLQAPAKAIYDGIVQNNLVGVYLDELNACKDAL